MKRSWIKRTNTLRAKRDPFGLRKHTLKLTGKKAKLRESINVKLRKRFKAMGLYEVCEVQFPECWNTDFTWMHGKKDRFLSMHEREFLVIRACSVCHRIADEELGHEKMLELVKSIIANRELVAA